MYLSYSGYKTYEDCPRSYWYKYIAKIAVLKPDNRVHMLYGAAVGYVFELFYNDQLWRRKDVHQALLELVPQILEKVMRRETTKGGVFDWKDPELRSGSRSLEEVRKEVEESIPGGLETIRMHRLLGKKAFAELKLDSQVEGHTLAGRSDFVINRVPPHNDLVIIDGKGSRWRDRYVDQRQLEWYAMLYQEKFGRLPDRVGFLFWKFKPGDNLDWVPFTPKDIEALRQRALDVIQTIESAERGIRASLPLAEAFPAYAGRDCKRCSFSSACPEGKAYLSQESVPIPEGTGVEDVEL